MAVTGAVVLAGRSRQPRSGHLLAAAALWLLFGYLAASGWLLPAGALTPAGIVVAQVAILAVAVGLVLVSQDAVRERVRLAERRLQHAIEALDQGFALYDPRDRLVLANQAYRRMFPRLGARFAPGTTYESLLRASAEAGQYVEAAGREEAWVQERLAHHRVGEQALEQQLADGRWVYLLERRTPAGEWVSLRVDITDIKQRERDLAESEARYRDLIEGSIQGIIIHHEWRLLFANEAAARMLGFEDATQLVGQGNLEPLIAPHEVDRIRRFREARFRGQPAPNHYVVDMLRRNGTDVTMDCLVRRIHWRGQMVTQATLVDITERKRAERQLRAQQDHLEELVAARTRELQAANEELEAFTYSVSHDLRAPVRRARGFAEALREDYGHLLDRDGLDYLDRLDGAVARMRQLIDDMLTLSRLSQAELAFGTVDLSAIATEVCERMRQESPDRQAHFDIEPGLVVEGDERLLRVVLENLLGNAWKYSAREARTEISVRRVQDAGSAYYEVRDNGVGFDMSYADRLFGPFQRLHGDQEFEGVGIGLATVQRIVHRHGGSLQAESRVGAGASFRFTLNPAERAAIRRSTA